MAIDTREELINALHEACEIEHALLVQYLYAGLSMKKGLVEGLTPHQQRLARDWQAGLFLIAREEMGHFAIACNLLAAIGAPAKFDRRAIPRRTDYFPFPFDLIPFSDDALHRFLVFELPRDYPKPPPPGADLRVQPSALRTRFIAPDPLEYEYVGELYTKIAHGFQSIAEQDLFIGPDEAQSPNNWSDRSLDIRVVTDRASALAAITEIIVDGEGTPQDRASSHYRRFEATRLAYFDEGRFSAARNVPLNPATREDPEASGTVTIIKNPMSLRLAELFNSAYGSMLMLLQHYFSLAPKQADTAGTARRLTVQAASQRLMSVAIRPIAEELTLAPLADPATPERAGPPFELYSDISLSPYPSARWIILLERFDALVDECRSLGKEFKRIEEIGESLSIMRRDLAAAAQGVA